MKVLKSILLVVLSISVLTLVSCNNNATPATDATTNTEAASTEATDASKCSNCEKANNGTCENACTCGEQEGGCKCTPSENCGKKGCEQTTPETSSKEQAAQ